MPGLKNRTLFHGDNLEMLRGIDSETVHLIATDPPFNKGRDFHATPDSLAAGASFQDRWTWDDDIKEWADQLLDDWPHIHHVIDGSRKSYGNDMGAFLCFMGVRLIEMWRVLRADGSIYLHCDTSASHYLKELMDSIFGRKNFRNEIIWKRTSSRVSGNRLGRVHDTILFYGKSDETKFQAVKIKRDQSYIDRFYKYKDAHGTYRISDLTGAGTSNGESGKPWRGVDPTKRGNHWRGRKTFPPHVKKPVGYEKMPVHKKLDKLDELGLIHWPKKQDGMPGFKLYLDEEDGMDITDVITDISPLSAKSTERKGYPTQKPVKLYEHFIQMSSNPGDIVLDPFCGCATTLIAAEKLNRRWIGMDIWDEAHHVVIDRLKNECFLEGPNDKRRDIIIPEGTIAYENSPHQNAPMTRKSRFHSSKPRRRSSRHAARRCRENK